MQTSGSLQELIELLTVEIRQMTPEEKQEFRQAWLSQIDKRQSDRRFLKSCGINPDGD